LINIRRISSSIFFSKGKLNELGQFVKKQEDIDVIFVNTMLTPLQQSKLEKRFNDFLQDREERLRRYYIRSANKSSNEPTDIDSSSGYVTGETEINPKRSVRVIDRFGIILMIFANRAKSNISRLQIELAWLNYARTNLSRSNGPTFGKLGKLFKESLTINPSKEVEIKSYKGRGTSGTGGIQGQGETQMELEKRSLDERRTTIRHQLKKEIKVREDHRLARQRRTRNIPLVALVGYTNVGKTTLMNKLTSESLGVEDRLFHTLTTTVRKCNLIGNLKADFIDTIGFISHLPHNLVESFKTTLEEILYADILIHVRDISHPNAIYQQQTVFRVLEEIGIDKSLLENGYVEVWNKLDLCSDEFIEQEILPNLSNQRYPIIPMSALNDPNRDEFTEALHSKINEIYDLKEHTLKYHYSEHSKRAEWLLKFANVSNLNDFIYDGENIKINVNIDDVVFQQYLKTFEREVFDASRDKSKLTPPAGW